MEWMELFDEDRADYEVLEDVCGKLHRIAARIETLKNASLIAAAPELLEALEALLAEWETKERADGREWGQREVIMARAAIDKAKGDV